MPTLHTTQLRNSTVQSIPLSPSRPPVCQGARPCQHAVHHRELHTACLWPRQRSQFKVQFLLNGYNFYTILQTGHIQGSLIWLNKRVGTLINEDDWEKVALNLRLERWLTRREVSENKKWSPRLGRQQESRVKVHIFTETEKSFVWQAEYDSRRSKRCKRASEQTMRPSRSRKGFTF